MHVIQPKHIKLTSKEAEELLKKYNITLAQLPKISKDDKGLLDDDYEKGDIIKIERAEEIYFRVVI